MSLLGSFKVNKSINTLLDARSVNPADLKDAIKNIRQAGGSAVPKLIEAILDDEKNSHIQKLLVELVNDNTLPEYIDALADEDKRIVTTVMKVLSTAKTYDPNALIKLFADPEIPQNVLVHILMAQKAGINGNAILGMLSKLQGHSRKAVLHVVNEIAKEDFIPHLQKYIDADDPGVRQQIASTLSRFNKPIVRDILLRMLSDSNKLVRQTAVQGLGKLTVPVPSKPLCQALRDPDMGVQAKAIETLAKNHDDELISNLVDVLQDDSEYVRRAAVEVLNEVCDQNSIKDLLNAMRDQDWWVKVRAADALGSIGGPKVVDAVINLITDEDNFLRRSAVEILNSINDERAFDHLVIALNDDDWWVRERAADALKQMGDPRAITPLVELMSHHPDSSSVALKALTEMHNESVVDSLIDFMPRSSSEIQKEVISTLEKLANNTNAQKIKDAINRLNTLSSQVAAPQPVTSNQQADASIPDLNISEPTVSTQTPSMDTTQVTNSADLFIDADTLQEGQLIDNRYRVIKKIGKGAFGVVLLVDDEMVHDHIILKFLNPHMASDESVIERFIHELRYSRKITHENIIRIYDFLTFGKSYAISMEYFESHSLAEEIRKRKHIDIARNIKIIIDICKGLMVAHNENIVHRDIKPANILVNDKDVVKIVDFGLAAAAVQGDARITKSGILVGTPTYMAPEQVRGRAIDTRTDIYSLGIVMYELFTGKPPYKGKDHMATLFMHVEGKAKPAREVNPKISEQLNNTIMKAIHVDPKQRYQSVDELRRDLVIALAKEIG